MRIDAEVFNKNKIKFTLWKPESETSWFAATPFGITLWLTAEEADSLVFKGGSAVQEMEMMRVKG